MAQLYYTNGADVRVELIGTNEVKKPKLLALSSSCNNVLVLGILPKKTCVDCWLH